MVTHYAPLKKLSQNFLKDAAVVDAICDALTDLHDKVTPVNAGERRRCVEVGPGPGALTVPLLKRGFDMVAVEKDPRAIKVLGSKENLHLIIDDVLRWQPDFESPRVCVGNLPYAISSPFLLWFLSQQKQLPAGVFMLQKEVVERIVASPGTAAYGRLSVRLQLCCDIRMLFKVPASAFFPAPQVDSAVFVIESRDPALSPFLLPGAAEAFEAFTATLFAARRKTLGRVMKQCAAQWFPGGVNETTLWRQLRDLGIEPQQRAEVLSPSQILALHKCIKQMSP